MEQDLVDTRTYPLKTTTDHTFALPTHPQLSSTFLHRLPYEIRVLVYQQVILDLSSSLLHIYVPEPNRFKPGANRIRICQPCICDETKYLQHRYWQGVKKTGSWGGTHLECRDASRENGEAVPELKTIFTLASSCRHLYHEFLPLFYASTTLNLVSLNRAYYFLFPPTHRLQFLHTIHITWMIFHTVNSPSISSESMKDPALTSDIQRLEIVCRILSTQLPALQELKMIFFHAFSSISETKILQPLLQIRKLSKNKFTVQLPWSEEDAKEPLILAMGGEVPFLVERRPVERYEDRSEEYDAMINEGSPGVWGPIIRTVPVQRERRRIRDVVWRGVCAGPVAVYGVGRSAAKGAGNMFLKHGGR